MNRSGRVEEIVCETRLWDEVKLVTYAMRRKEGLADYRYFPEPDLPPLVLSEEMIEEVRVSPTHTALICEDRDQTIVRQQPWLACDGCCG